MATRLYTSEELISTVRLRAMVPNHSQIGTADSDLLRHLNEALLNELIPQVMKVKEEFFVITRRQPIVAGRNRYRLPARAIGQKLRKVALVDSSGERIDIPRISLDDLDLYDTTTTGDAIAYYMEGNTVVLIPDEITTTNQLELSYFFRPGELVLANGTRLVSQVVGGMVSFTTDPAGFITTTSLYDFHSPKSGSEIKSFDVPFSTVGGFTATTSVASIDGTAFGSSPVEAGDYCCLAGQAALPGIPRELHPALAQAAVCKVVESLGDFEAVQFHTAELNRMLQLAGYMLETRVEGAPLKVLNDSGWRLYGG